MTTHYIEEAERLADEVAVMTAGRIIAQGKPAALIAEHAGRETAEVYGPPDRLAEVRGLAEAQGLRSARRDRRSQWWAPSASTAPCPDDAIRLPHRSRTSSSCSRGRRRGARTEPDA